MRKFQKAAVVAAILGTIGFAGAGTAFAGDHGSDRYEVTQATSCKSHDLNADVLGEVGVLNGLLGNAVNGEGNPGGQATAIGSTAGCSNDAF